MLSINLLLFLITITIVNGIYIEETITSDDLVLYEKIFRFYNTSFFFDLNVLFKKNDFNEMFFVVCNGDVYADINGNFGMDSQLPTQCYLEAPFTRCDYAQRLRHGVNVVDSKVVDVPEQGSFVFLVYNCMGSDVNVNISGALMNADSDHLSRYEGGVTAFFIVFGIIWLAFFAVVLLNWFFYRGWSGVIHKLFVSLIIVRLIRVICGYFYWEHMISDGKIAPFWDFLNSEDYYEICKIIFLIMLTKGFHIVRNKVTNFEIHSFLSLFVAYVGISVMSHFVDAWNIQIAFIVIRIGLYKIAFSSLGYVSSKLYLQQQYLHVQNYRNNETIENILDPKIFLYGLIRFTLLLHIVVVSGLVVLYYYLPQYVLLISALTEISEFLLLVALFFPLRLGYIDYAWKRNKKLEDEAFSKTVQKVFLIQYPKKHDSTKPNITFATRNTSHFRLIQTESSD